MALSPTPGSSPLGVSPVAQNKFHPLLEPATNQSLVHCDSNESLAHRSSESSIPSNHTTPNHMLNLNHTGKYAEATSNVAINQASAYFGFFICVHELQSDAFCNCIENLKVFITYHSVII